MLRKKLENDVRKLQDEIKKLKQQLPGASAGIPGSQTLWGAATEYFRLFRNGFRSPSAEVYKYVLNTLVSFMTPDVRDGLVCGPKAILARWMMFSLYFDDIYVDLQGLEKGRVGNSVVATTVTSITISNNSMRLVFPHLVEKGGADSVISLADKLRGQRLEVRGSVVFEWDNTIGRVSKMRSQSDMLTPLLRVLGNLDDVSHVFEGALVTPECGWVQSLL
ncbi:hypothetical protein PHMEG_00016113 [Phytophthora megakarya]|uniref:Bzip transcription factor n=1 Tax=Phytophthora megakarya TaxID=4795 RepID=A0A225W154_9STRA|nr:hypothetical protein PHMEG_00016113 [Phytophthora megakarya]